MSDADANSGQIGDWMYLRGEIWRRSRQPLSSAPFVFYVFVAIILLGCLGIWVELVKTFLDRDERSYDAVLTALATFYPALIGSASFQLILSSTGKADKILVSFAHGAAYMSIVSVPLIAVVYPALPGWCFAVAILFSLVAVWLWWVTNGDDPTYKTVPIDAPSGGDTRRKLKGDISDFKAD